MEQERHGSQKKKEEEEEENVVVVVGIEDFFEEDLVGQVEE